MHKFADLQKSPARSMQGISDMQQIKGGNIRNAEKDS